MIVILHLGSHSGRGHPICSHFRRGYHFFNPGRLNAPAPTSLFFLPETHRHTHTDRQDTQTHTPPDNRTPPRLGPSPTSLPVARPMVIVGTHGCGQGRVGDVLWCLCCKRVGPGHVPCAGLALCTVFALLVEAVPLRDVRCGRCLHLLARPLRALGVTSIAGDIPELELLCRLALKEKKDRCQISDIRQAGRCGFLLAV